MLLFFTDSRLDILLSVVFIKKKHVEVKGRKPTLKKNPIGKIIELIESFELCDIWRMQDPTEKMFYFSSKSHFRIHTVKA